MGFKPHVDNTNPVQQFTKVYEEMIIYIDTSERTPSCLPTDVS